MQEKGALSSPSTSMATILTLDGSKTGWKTMWTGDVDCLATAASEWLSYKADGLTPGHLYVFRVSARNALGWSGASRPTDGTCTNGTYKQYSSTTTSNAHMIFCNMGF